MTANFNYYLICTLRKPKKNGECNPFGQSYEYKCNSKVTITLCRKYLDAKFVLLVISTKFGYLMYDAQAMAIGKPHGLELVINKCKLGPILGGGWKHTRDPEESHVSVRLRGLQPVEVSLDTIFVLHSIHRLSILSNLNKFSRNF